MPEEIKEENKTTAYNPTELMKTRIKFLYDERTDMLDKRNQSYPQFNDRTLREFIDDSEKRLNAYVLSKEEQGKEDWQANFATRAYANKAKALIAATARSVPEFRYKAVDKNDSYKFLAADIIKNLVTHSYNQGNPQEDTFFAAWSCLGKGTVVDYEGFEKQTFIKKRIKSYDMETGDVEEEEMENSSYGEPLSYEVPLMNLLVKNFYIRDIQEQPSIIHEIYYADKERFDANYGKYKNSKNVPDLKDIKPEENDTYFKAAWSEQVSSGKGYLVCRYMNKYKDIYRIVANGVELFNGPMLWIDITRKNFGKKAYPFAKTIYEPFANSDFFYGNSLPNSAMGEGDVLNTLYNSALDKTYRSMVPPLLIGMVNKDMLDLEDEMVAGDTKIYVDDINQVKQMDIKGISDSDVKMIDLISKGLDLTTLDPHQEGAAQKYVTARAALSADERARQLKGVFVMFLESFWLQKVKLRVPNILISYAMPKLVKIIGEEGAQKIEEKYRLFNVEKAQLSDGTKGTLGIQFMNREDMADRKALRLDLETEEQVNTNNGISYEKVILPFDYLDNLSFDIEIVPESLLQGSDAINLALVMEKTSLVQKFFPEYFAANKELLFTDIVRAYKDDPSRFDLPQAQSFEDQQALALAQGKKGKAGGTSAGGGLLGDLSGSDTNNPLGGV